MGGRVVTASSEHEVIYKELAELVARHAPLITAEEVLAIAANMVGKLMAMQDQRTMTPDRALDIVIKNLELGNEQAVAQVMQSKGSA